MTGTTDHTTRMLRQLKAAVDGHVSRSPRSDLIKVYALGKEVTIAPDGTILETHGVAQRVGEILEEEGLKRPQTAE